MGYSKTVCKAIGGPLGGTKRPNVIFHGLAVHFNVEPLRQSLEISVLCDCLIEQMQQLVNLVRSWEPSLSGHVNFIVDGDGVILGPNKSSLGGVLHDENGDIVVFF
ncbi:hypothetical protein Gohar_010390 [Gossypium harknessii]|uniref:Uncharacterized protein n=1 Tax=Gossypium harknessii TaxID=34285 RepID=A0A7J9GQR3_9ROSI|nr:hypothetical protein [Gossypium harknessii]